ncbi:cytochrome P450 [Planosporangium flavigriseum]|uniref:Cytochrome P450 n=1 Tax=Planosporangium flavigriseum TaxID=373681 RepID=A0A8J3LPU5_9ACTN|nr:cytochrome P450 [Planosporangium flavigriseum]NJC65195.1 cytochrome P450 [Planosporangium flavigriseum]GIG71814.1 cytochrome P450 [Planosporangium flavigriseum]
MSGTTATQPTPADLPLFPFPEPVAHPLDPPAYRDLLSGEAPITRVALPTGGWAWLVTRLAEVREVLRHPAFSADIAKPGFPLLRPLPRPRDRDRAGLFIRMDPPEHGRYRRMLTPEFMIKSIRRLEPLIQQTVDRFLDDMVAAGPPADLVDAYALPVPSLVICHLLGVPYEDHCFFQSRSRVLLNSSVSVEEAQGAADELRDYLSRLVTAKQRDGGDDLLARLVAGRLRGGALTHDEAVGMAVLLLVAGHETTANMIGLSTLVLLRHPDQYAALRDDPGRAPALVEELLRYLTIVRTGLPRLALADVEIGGTRIRAGEGVIALLSVANRDEGAFADADRFDVDRGAHQHVAFGFGVHQCIGQPLARAELRIALVALAERLPALRLAIPDDEVPLRRDSFIYGLQRLPVTW